MRLDFRETAPEGVRKELYVKDGRPVPSLSLTGALAVAVPGEVAGLAQAHRRFGSMPMQVLMAPAIRLASNGFPLDATLRYAIDRQQGSIKKFPDLGRIYMPNDEVPAEGELIRQPELGETLKAIASQGCQRFLSRLDCRRDCRNDQKRRRGFKQRRSEKLSTRVARTSHRQLSPAHSHQHAAAQFRRRGDFANAKSA